MKIKQKLFSIGIKVSMVYVIYALVFAIIPYALPKHITEEKKQALQKELHKKENSHANRENRATLINEPEDAFNIRIKLIQAAKENLDISCHRIKYDGSSEAIMAEVLAAADRGVHVRLLIDGAIHLPFDQTTIQLKKLALHQNIDFFTYANLNPLKPWAWNSLLHDKYIIVDNDYLLVGGRNMGDRYYHPAGYEGAVTNDKDVLVWNKEKASSKEHVINQTKDYMEKMLALPYVKEKKAHASADSKKIHTFFNELRSHRVSYKKQQKKLYAHSLDDYLAQSVSIKNAYIITGEIEDVKKEPTLAYQMQMLAEMAEDKVVVQTPYATANKELLQAFDTVDKKVKKVEMLTNSPTSTPNAVAFSNYYGQRQKFLDTGVEIYEYQKKDSLHDKMMLIDENKAVIGSFNLDDRSMYIDTETMIVIESEELSKELSKMVQEYQADSLIVDKDTNDYEKGSKVEKIEPTFMRKVSVTVLSYLTRLFQFLI